MLSTLREAYPWHVLLALVPWLIAPIGPAQPDATKKVLLARVLFVVLSSGLVFRSFLLPIWTWLLVLPPPQW
jgi:hypothetical protein